MPKKLTPKAPVSSHPIAPRKAISAELLAKAYRLGKQAGTPARKRKTPAIKLDDMLAFSQTPEGMAKTRAFIRRSGKPIYSAHPKHSDIIVETSPDGTRRAGMFVDRNFVECIMPTLKKKASTDKNAPPADPRPMSPDSLGKQAHRLAKSKSRALSAKLTKEIT